ncbi:hypothetical protein BD309DRAFT_582812 [Dichomitus squalens]|uniref:Uncharacterized protein n=1 Tax=Dichomitus squalens TaxID=114155 RepID=A0A4V2K525_9APHY|nr:hypothetical protein BD309DRAFT_582812 [Dichomitus squalens]TBU60499.1 hypothetical protein BD310DRAFT_319628 [Dichomitus squalens]
MFRWGGCERYPRVPLGGVREYVNGAIQGKAAYLVYSYLHSCRCSRIVIIFASIGMDVQAGVGEISERGHISDCPILPWDSSSSIRAASGIAWSPAMCKAVPCNHRRIFSQKHPRPAPEPALGVSPSVPTPAEPERRRCAGLRTTTAIYTFRPANHIMLPIPSPGMRCLCVARLSLCPTEAVISDFPAAASSRICGEDAE